MWSDAVGYPGPWPALGKTAVRTPCFLEWRTSWGRRERRTVHMGVKYTVPAHVFVQITSHLHSRSDTWICANHISSLFVVLEAALTCWVAFKLLFPLEHLVWRSPSHSSVCLYFVASGNSSPFLHLQLEKCMTSCILLILLGVLMP